MMILTIKMVVMSATLPTLRWTLSAAQGVFADRCMASLFSSRTILKRAICQLPLDRLRSGRT
jgi:hypothetical protein